MSALVSMLADACSLWTVLSHACLGVVDATFTTTPSAPISLSCALCGLGHLKEYPNIPVSRCSRCKAVGYCCKRHQQEHWKMHKSECCSHTKPSTAAVITNPTTVVSSIQDTDDILSKLHAKFDEKGAMTFQSIVRSVLRTIVDYLKFYQDLIMFLQGEMGGVGGSYALTNGMNSRSSPKRMMMNITEWTLMSLLSAQMVEVIANFAFILGTKFKARLIDVFYILIELTVDQNADVIVRQASASTLRRIAIYLEYDDVYSMLKDNLDYVVDNTCVQLRNSVTLSYMHTLI